MSYVIEGRPTYVVADNQTKQNPCGHPHGSPAEAWLCHSEAISNLSQPLSNRNVYASDGGVLRALNEAEWAALRDHWRLTMPTTFAFVEEPEARGAQVQLVLSASDAARLRSMLRSIINTAGNESASEEALEACGRTAARALSIVNQTQSLTNMEMTTNA